MYSMDIIEPISIKHKNNKETCFGNRVDCGGVCVVDYLV